MLHFLQVAVRERERAATVSVSRLGRRKRARYLRWSAGERRILEQVCRVQIVSARSPVLLFVILIHLADAVQDAQAVLEISNMEYRQDEFDVGIMSHAICKYETAGATLLRLVAGSKSTVEDTIGDGAAVFELVEITLGSLKLGNGDNLLRREDGELNVFTTW